MSLFAEIRRRKVFQVAAVYAVVAWLLIQIVATVEAPLNLPGWFDTAIIVALAIGLPIAIILSWAFDLTPDGVVRDRGAIATSEPTSRTLEYLLIGSLSIAVLILLYREFSPEETSVPSGSEVLSNSVAVLPLENLSPDPENAYIAAGLHDEILNQLAKLRDLSVISRTAVLQYANDRPSIQEIAEALKVESVMEGTVRYAGNRIRVTTQLIDPATGLHIWSETYDREFQDIFAVESDIATNVAIALQAELSPEERQRIERPLTRSPDAYRLFLQATNLGIHGPEGLGPTYELQNYLDQALALDSGFARAHALKSFDYAFALVRARRPGDPETEELERLAWEHAGRALSLDPEESLAYVAMANIGRFNWRAMEAEGAFEKALQLAPNDSFGLQSFAHFLSFLGEFDRATELAKRAVELDPSSIVLGNVLLRSGAFDEAYEAYEMVVSAGAITSGNWGLATAEARRGNVDAAYRQTRIFEELAPKGDPSALVDLISLYGQIGYHEDALRLFRSLELAAADSHVPASRWALAYLGVGDAENALEQLRRIDRERKPEDSLYSFALATREFGHPALERDDFVEVRNRLALRR